MFYMVCATLVISVYFPFSSKPERIYVSLRRRFFRHCARIMQVNAAPATFTNNISLLLLGSGAPLLTKMATWGPQIDDSLFADDDSRHIAALNRACELLHGQIQVLVLRRRDFQANPLVTAARRKSRGNAIATLCQCLAEHAPPEAFEQLRPNLTGIEAQLNELLGDDYLDRYDSHELAQFYVYLHLHASIFESMQACREAQQALDWQRLGETRF
jgi:hypothetical protein